LAFAVCGNAALRRWRVEPPAREDIATRTLLQRARHAQRKADRRLAAVQTGSDAMLHRARKGAKRARYAAELCEPVDKPKRAKTNHQALQAHTKPAW
jgi:CHAD domain-containing protein